MSRNEKKGHGGKHARQKSGPALAVLPDRRRRPCYLPLIPTYCSITGAPYKIEHLIDVTSINVNCTTWRDFDVSSKLFTLK